MMRRTVLTSLDVTLSALSSKALALAQRLDVHGECDDVVFMVRG